MAEELQEKGIRPTAEVMQNMLSQNSKPFSKPTYFYPNEIEVKHPSLKEYDILMGVKK